MAKRTARTEPGEAAVVPVDKPEGPTSHDVVAQVRRSLGERRVGHTGTLDPFASGLLLLCVARATRLAEFFHLLPKRYRALVIFGAETTTDDVTGEAVRRSDAWKAMDPEMVQRGLQEFTGPIHQVPPAFSAKKVSGRRAYEAARAGDDIALAASPVTVHQLRMETYDPPHAELDAWVSTGTYVRALARDIGRHLGCLAHLGALRREAIGPFRVAEAAPSLDAGALRRARKTPAEALGWMWTRALDADEAAAVGHGAAVPQGRLDPPALGLGYDCGPTTTWPVALIRAGRLVAVARRDVQVLRPMKVFDVA